ncbi:hypothetical protein N7469_009454 [Penicillium citrinum]|uniref:Uncharacterized protein n=1 Tax=Penicillium citrinum TaxID=5077 RepID=A0A9W9NNH4_PENCI|nr:hypothetical protein N7469_009454 [Penicillium citrinum]
MNQPDNTFVEHARGVPRRRSGRGPRAAAPLPEGGGVEDRDHGWGARGARPARRPRRTGDDTGGHPIAPTKPLSAGPHAGVPAWPPGRAEAGCGIRPSGGGSGPRGRRRRTADPTGRLPPGIWCQAWPAAIHPQTPSVPGAQRPPGFGRSDDGPSGGEPGGGRVAAADDLPSGVVSDTRSRKAPAPGRGSFRQGRVPSIPPTPGNEAQQHVGGGRGGGLRMPGTKSRLHIRSRVGGEALHQTPSYTLRPLLGGYYGDGPCTTFFPYAPEVVRGSPPRPAPPANSHPPTGESARAATRGESAPGPPRAAHHPPTPGARQARGRSDARLGYPRIGRVATRRGRRRRGPHGEGPRRVRAPGLARTSPAPRPRNPRPR